MKIIKGNFAEAKIFTDDVEQYAQGQIKMICDNQVAEGGIIRIMPDVHPGKVGPIGLTMTIGTKIIPNLLGIDIGCGITCVQVKGKALELQKLDKVIRERIPSGFEIRKKIHHLADEFVLEELKCYKHVNSNKAALSLGTLGGGNHFIEADKDEEGKLYIVIHSGSRHLGKEVTDYYVDAGAKVLKEANLDVPYPMTWIDGELMGNYIHDIKIVQKYAELNRKIMLEEILKGMKLKVVDSFSCIHNYIDDSSDTLMLRKGAISAKQGETVIIPVNMRDGVILGVGKGNAEWNDSAPHGSGRSIRRDEVKNYYTVSAFKNEMKGIYCSCIGTDTLDEAPFAYRRLEQLLENISETVEVTKILKPVYNFKAGGKA